MKSLPCITLNRYAQERAKKRHPWIFSNELGDPKILGRIEPGALVEVLDCHGGYLGTGFVNPQSLIAVRILSRNRGERIDGDFFRTKIERALDLRDTVYGATTEARSTYRAVFGEGDGLPGLIIDRYTGAWVIEPHALGMYLQLDGIAQTLAEIASDRYGEKNPCVVVRSDSRSAALEGIEQKSEVVIGSLGGVYAVEHGIRFPVDPLSGQKTGFFFDQRENRRLFRSWVEGKSSIGQRSKVLDVFCHAGAWGLGTLKAGAAHCTFVDSSAAALESVRAAARELGVEDKIELIRSDGLAALKAMQDRSFDAIALDPPALIQSKKSFSQGSKNYRELNAEAFRLTSAQGVLSTSSCSFHMLEERFEEVVLRAMLDAGRDFRILCRGAMGLDHPTLPSMQEGRYLKNLFLAN